MNERSMTNDLRQDGRDDRQSAPMRALQPTALILTIVNVLLALNFFPLVPFLGWLNYGHADWATAWIPDVVLLLVLPAAYFVYWHYWFAIAVPATLMALYLYRRTGDPRARTLTLINGATILVFWIVRIVMAIFDVHPDIV